MSQHRVLVVDDDPAILQLYQEVLTTDGYQVTTAGSCADAMAKMESVDGAIDVLLVDIGLPDGDGSDFARDAMARWGARPTLYVSGWTDEFWQLQEAPGRWVVFQKPVPIKRLRAAVRWLAEGGPKPPELDAEG